MSEQFLAWFNEMLSGLKCDVNSWEFVYGMGGGGGGEELYISEKASSVC